MDVRARNRAAWDAQVRRGNPWTVPVTPDAIRAARGGTWEIVLTPTRPVPASWFPELNGCRVLCLASGGGQQGPILAAAGARVTVFDNSPRQLAQDAMVAEREGLALETLEGDMRDLGGFDAGKFDLVFHPCANAFVPDVLPVWREAHRVLARGGVLLAGFTNPVLYVFDENLAKSGELRVRHALPYSDASCLSQDELRALEQEDEPLVFSHSLEEQIGGQLQAGFTLLDLYEDVSPKQPACRYFPAYVATRAMKA